jgi:hypothetical protein
MEPYVDEHLTTEPGGIEITTRSQRRKLMDREGIVPKHVGGPTGRRYVDLGAKNRG